MRRLPDASKIPGGRPKWPAGEAGSALGGRRARLVTALDLLILALSAAALFTVVTNGIRFQLGSFRVSVRDPLRLGIALLPLIAIRALLWRGALVPAFARGHRTLLQIVPHLAVTCIFLTSVAQFYRPGTGFTSMMAFGSQFDRDALPAVRQVPHEVVPGSGYDGQFYAQIAVDPFLRDIDSLNAAVDALGIRARRVLIPAMVYVVGAGHPPWILQVYSLVNVVTWLLLAWLLLRWLPVGQVRTTLAWAACLLSHGLLASVNYALLDGPSVLLLALAVVAIERRRTWLATAILALAGLAKETNVLAAGILLPDGRSTARRAGMVAVVIVQGLAVALPLAVWLVYLDRIGLPSFRSTPGTWGVPLAAYADKWRMTISELWTNGWTDSVARVSVLGLIAMTTQVLVLLASFRERRHAWWRIGVAYIPMLAVSGYLVWEGTPGSYARIVLPVTFAFNILLPANRWFWPLFILGNANILHGIQGITVPWLR